jgi:hypothetical protein
MKKEVRIWDPINKKSGIIVRSGIMTVVKWIDNCSFTGYRRLPKHFKVFY